MMYNYPFFSFPRFRRYGVYEPYSSYSKISMPYHSSKTAMENKAITNKSYSNHYSSNSLNRNNLQENSKHFNLQNSSNNSKKSTSSQPIRKSVEDEKPIFEIFGLQLYYDDILLICLIFFLYQEGVQDEYLFIALVLLLLS